MDYQDMFQEYYSLFRGDNAIPGVTDPEWALGVYAGNRAIRSWANTDAEDWDVLWTTAVAQGFSHTWQGTSASPTTATFDCPDNLARPGGFIQFTDPVSGTFIHIAVVKLQAVQFQTASGPYAYFTGGEQPGFQLTIVFSGSSNNSWIIDFPMYMTPTYFDASLTSDGLGNVNEDGSTVTEVPDPTYLIASMQAARLFETRNPFFQQREKDAAIALQAMQLRNGTGTPGNPWNLNDSNKTGSFGPGNSPAITNSGFGG